jgi:putative PIN family toxin of toxin-antitoxin system
VRIVLDTNVLIAAFIARGLCHQLLEHCISHHELVISEFILDEFREKLVAKFKYAPEVTDEAVKLLRSQMKLVTPAPLDRPVCRDADDDNVLATAMAGDCQCIITGDKDLLVLKRFQEIDILSPSGFQAYRKEMNEPRQTG